MLCGHNKHLLKLLETSFPVFMSHVTEDAYGLITHLAAFTGDDTIVNS